MKQTNAAPASAGKKAAPQLFLVPLDGSCIAEQALATAAALAHRSGARLHLATSVQPFPAPVIVASAEEPMVDPALEEELRLQSAVYLKSTAQALGTQGPEVTTALLEGAPARTLAEYARAKGIGLIVMTTHGHTGLNRLWLGSVADQLLRWVAVPVLLLRPAEGRQPTEFQRIVVALDGSSEGEQVLDPAIELGCLSQSPEFIVIRVVEPPIALITRMALQPGKMRPHWRELQENRARSYLDRIAKRMHARGLRVDTQLIPARGVGGQILNFAEARRADLVAVGTHGARGVERMLLGSVADKVIRGASCPVLVVPTRRGKRRGRAGAEKGSG